MPVEPKSRKGIGGPRTKLNPETQRKIIEAIEAGNYTSVACAYAGICESSYYEWIQKGEADPGSVYGGFWEAVRLAEATAEVRVVRMTQEAIPTNWAAGMTWLERRHATRWRRREGLDVKVSKMSDDDLIARTTGVLNGGSAAGSDAALGGPEPEPLP